MAQGIKFYYSVKNAAQSDIDAAELIVYESLQGIIDDYKILQYNTAHNFTGTPAADFVQEMTPEEVILNQYNPYFVDISQIDPYELGRNLIAGASFNKKMLYDAIIETAAGHLFKNSGSWTQPQKDAFNAYWERVKRVADLGNVGRVRDLILADKAILQQPANIEVANLETSNFVAGTFTGSNYVVDVLTVAMLDHLIAICDTYKKKFPDGTI